MQLCPILSAIRTEKVSVGFGQQVSLCPKLRRSRKAIMLKEMIPCNDLGYSFTALPIT